MLPSGPFASKLGFTLSRVLVPLWVLTGAVFKLVEKTPKLLPRNIWTTAAEWGVNLYWLLAVLIALELFAVAVMTCMPRLARYMALWMLGCFCLILIGELAAGHSKCGCLGAFSPSPWVMLGIDGTLLVLVAVFRPSSDRKWLAGLVPAAVLTLAGFAVSGAVVLPENRGTEREAPAPAAPGARPESAAAAPAAGTREPPLRRLPGYHALVADGWQGRRFLDTEIAGFVDGWPEDLEVGPRYVIFYSRSCDHCQAYLEMHFAANAPVPTTLVAIPESKKGFTPETHLDMLYCQECVQHLELPAGVDWIITPPVVIALESGTVVCAKEGDDPAAPECLSWH